MANSLLSHYVEMLHLRPDAPYQNMSPMEMLREWKRERTRLDVDSRCRDTDDLFDPVVVGVDEP